MGVPIEALGPRARAQALVKMSIEEARRQNRDATAVKDAPKRRNKLGNEKVHGFLADGTPHRFDSKHEYERYGELALMERVGEIIDLRLQVPFELVPKQKRADGTTERAVVYVADFVYQKDGETVVEDAKGYRNPASAVYRVFAIKRKLLRWRYGIEVREV